MVTYIKIEHKLYQKLCENINTNDDIYKYKKYINVYVYNVSTY